MKKSFPLKHNFFFLLFFLLGLLFFSFFLFLQEPKKADTHLAIIPHFMLASEKVDEFYTFLKDQRYPEKDPDTIIVISPNHYNSHSTTPQTICEPNAIYFKNKSYSLTPFPGVACDGQIFFPFGNALTTKEHGIGEHLVWINKYFPDTKTIIPLILPTHREPFSLSDILLKSSGNIIWNLLIIASVDFSHYLPEETARANDQISIQTLQSWTGTWSDFRTLDVDCPACLFSLQQLANQKDQQAHLYYRDSSSTIFWRDMREENTSRVFMRYEYYF